MFDIIQKVNASFKKPHVIDVRSGDTVRVHQRIREGNKERVQVFEGVVIRVDRRGSLSHRIVVRKIASGVGVEKSFLLHNPLVEKVEVTKRSKVRRNYLTYLRERSGKSARLKAVDFDRAGINAVPEKEIAQEETAVEAEKK